MRQVQDQELKREPNVLIGPPGLLFGLTLLVFICARLYLGWVTAHEPPPEAVLPTESTTPRVSALHVLDTEKSPAHRYHFVTP